MAAVFAPMRSGAAAIFAALRTSSESGIVYKDLALSYTVYTSTASVAASYSIVYNVSGSAVEVQSNIEFEFEVAGVAGLVDASLAVAYEIRGLAMFVSASQVLSYVVVGLSGPVRKDYPVTFAVAGVVPPAIGIPGPQSAARTYVVTEPQIRPSDTSVKGSFWNYANPAKPKGIKDPESVIDIPFDWTAWFADATDSYGSHSFRVTGGGVIISSYQKDGVVVPFLAGGTREATVALTCHVKSNSSPPREEERTVYLKIKDL